MYTPITRSPDQDGPMFSIICATYNRAPKLHRAIQSVLRLTTTDWELIIIDDGSTDNTYQLMESYKRNEHITYIRLTQNRGVGAARNVGIAKARGEWILTLDSDNALSEDSLFIMAAAIKKYPGCYLHKFSVESFLGKSMGTRLDKDIILKGRDYLCNRPHGEFQTLTHNALLGKNPYFEIINGGEGITWALLAQKTPTVIFHPHITLIYDTDGDDRLCFKKNNYGRLCLVWKVDITHLWVNYLYGCPLRLIINIIKVLAYCGLKIIKR